MVCAMAELIRGHRPGPVRANLERVRERAGDGVEILVATKYVPGSSEMGALAEAGVELVGENRLQDLERKRERWRRRFDWDFIGALQSRKVQRDRAAGAPDPLGLQRLGAASSSATPPPETEVLVQVNVAGEESKAGVAPGRARRISSRAARSRVAGLMTMPPFTDDPEASRPYFARLAELAAEHGLERLSMGTSQDWQVAVEEGATIDPARHRRAAYGTLSGS